MAVPETDPRLVERRHAEGGELIELLSRVREQERMDADIAELSRRRAALAEFRDATEARRERARAR